MIDFSIVTKFFFLTPGSSGLATAQVGIKSAMDILIMA
jgi:hypothetical protein